MKVRFVNVGRDHKSWEAETPSVSYEWLEHQVKRNGRLMSNQIDFSDERSGEDLPVDGAFGSVLVGGFRPVGRYYIGEAIPQDTMESAQTSPNTGSTPVEATSAHA